MPRSLTRHIARGAGIALGGQILQTLTTLIVITVLARLLTPADFGLVTASMMIVTLAQLFTQIGLGPALVQRAEIEPDHIKVAFTGSLVLGLALGLVILLAANPIAALFPIPHLNGAIRALAVVFPIASVSIVAESLSQREMQFRFLTIARTASYVLGYGATALILAALGFGYWSLIIGQIVSAVMRMAITLVAQRSAIGWSRSIRHLRDLTNFGLGFSLTRIANYGANQADNYVVALETGAADLGLYSRAYQLMMIPATLIGSIADFVIFPALSAVRTDMGRVVGAFQQALAVTTLLTVPISIVSIVCARQIVLLALGERWLAVVPIFQILSAATTFRAGYKICDSLVRSLGAVRRHLVNQSTYAVSVLLAAAFGMNWGLVGVATGVALAIMINFGLMLRLCVNLMEVSFTPIWAIYLRQMVCGAVAFGTAVAVKGLVQDNMAALFTLVVVTLAVGIVYLVLGTAANRLLGTEINIACRLAQAIVRK